MEKAVAPVGRSSSVKQLLVVTVSAHLVLKMSHLDGHACTVKALSEQDRAAAHPVEGRGELQLQAGRG